MKLRHLTIPLLAVLIAACGGGGGGGTTGGGTTGTAEAVGRVLDVQTGGATNPQSSVQIGTNSTLTSVADGFFSITGPVGTTSLTIDTRSAFGLWVFATPPLAGVTDVGDLWVGPQRVTLRGRVLRSTDLAPIGGATVRFAGRSGTTDANGLFSLADVAYSNATQAAFWGIRGTVTAGNFFSTEFSAQPNVAVGGIVTVNDILMTPSNDTNPPPPPFNIWGRISPSADGPGTVATLKLNGVAVRIYNVGADATYYFWVAPGDYTIEFLQPSNGKTAQTAVSLTATNQVVRQDVTLQ